ncbi:pyridoxamine 5'-phosphate oxidase family protein [Streptomyces albidoflavus]
MTKTPAPRQLSDAELSALLEEQRFGTLATNKRDGHPHLTTMSFAWDPATRVLRFSTTESRAKAKHLRRDPRASLHVPGGDVWSFAVAEGEAEVSEVTAVPGDAIGRELLAAVPESLRPGTVDEEAAFLAHLVAERRVVIRLAVSRLYGTALDISA